jgi:hypothetical protein
MLTGKSQSMTITMNKKGEKEAAAPLQSYCKYEEAVLKGKHKFFEYFSSQD